MIGYKQVRTCVIDVFTEIREREKVEEQDKVILWEQKGQETKRASSEARARFVS
jgi:hypothetical protein